MRSWIIAGTTVCALLAACSKPMTTPARVSSPFTEADTTLFDDGIDTVADPDALSGRWAEDWNQEMLQRTRRADLIVLVEVTTLLTDTDPEGHLTHRLVVTIEKTIKGKPPGDELSFSSPSTAVGFPSVDSNKGRLLHMHLLALVKWVAQPDGSVTSHFHLAAGSEKVLSRVRSNLERDTPQDRTVIERRYDSSKGETPESSDDATEP